MGGRWTGKISTSHINSAVKEEIQEDFMYVSIHGNMHGILNIVDKDTRYRDRPITTFLSAEEMTRQELVKSSSSTETL